MSPSTDYSGLTSHAKDDEDPYEPPAHSGRADRYSTASQDGLLHNAAGPATSERAPDRQQLKIQAIHNEVENTKHVLTENLQRIQERGELMEDLQGKTDSLAIQSRAFKTEGRKVHRKMWWKNAKWTICLSILLILIIAGAVAGGIKGSEVVKEKIVVHETSNATLMPNSGTGTSTKTGSATQVSTSDISKASNV